MTKGNSPVNSFPLDETDHEFMTALYTKYQMSMLRMAHALTDSVHDAEDVVGESCVSLIRNISRIRQLDGNSLEGYVISTVKSTAFLLHRKKKARSEAAFDEALHYAADKNAAPDRFILLKCSLQELIHAIAQLSESDQLVLRLKYLEKHSDRDIALTLGIQEVSVRSRLTRARQRISTLLKDSINER